ncbi:hypothetical protein EZV62_014818 [Acer yangbiense]|uniref:Uncharacterized protein n=1 Tax=Acer yangbiense TaxID=1000413 RepID=A0A5C7HTT6_9ROSI|nr:hypothetical protein EZV62_014818 [Acer yangbiense]
MFEIEKNPYIPFAPEASSNIPNSHHRFKGDIQDLNFSDFEDNLFSNEGDNEDDESEAKDQVGLGDDNIREDGLGDESDEVGGIPGMRELAVVHEVPDEVGAIPDDSVNLDLFEGYQSKSDDEFFSDPGDENSDAKLARVMKSNSFKKLVGSVQGISMPISELHIMDKNLGNYSGKLVSGVPCSYALAGIRHYYGVSGNKDNLIDLINPSLSKSAYLKTYCSMIHPIPHLGVWADLETAHMEPPPLKRKPGRPKLLRKRESNEKPKAARTVVLFVESADNLVIMQGHVKVSTLLEALK